MTLRTIASFALLLLATSALAGERSPRIVIDAGHGGSQEGAKGPGNLLEKEVVLQIAKKLRARLEKEAGAQVFLTRERGGGQQQQREGGDGAERHAAVDATEGRALG